MKQSALGISLLLVCLAPAFSLLGGDWPQFRGPGGLGVSEETGLPTTWGDSENLVWKTELPGAGTSSPIAVGDRVFVTCYSGYGVGAARGDQSKLVRHLLCLDAKDGTILWKTDFPARLPEDNYSGFISEHGYASSTPACDGQRVYVFFGKSGVFACDMQGKKLWEADVGTGSAINNWGTAASPTLTEKLVIVNANAESESVVALDKETGKPVWKAQAEGYRGSWSTPLVVDVDGRQEIVVNVAGEVWSLSPNDGGILWYCTTGRSPATIPTVTAGKGVVYAMLGGPGNAASVAVRTGGRNDVSGSHVVWRKSVGSYVPSPVLVGDYLHWADNSGVAYCVRADSGEQVYRERVSGAGNVYASLVAADGKLYLVSRRNGTFVLRAGEKFEVLATNKFSDDSTDFNATPAIHNGRLLLRSNKAIYCVGAK
jgi:hypothetical protein